MNWKDSKYSVERTEDRSKRNGLGKIATKQDRKCTLREKSHTFCNSPSNSIRKSFKQLKIQGRFIEGFYFTKMYVKYLQNLKPPIYENKLSLRRVSRICRQRRHFLLRIDAAMQGEMPLFESILCIQEASYVTENG